MLPWLFNHIIKLINHAWMKSAIRLRIITFPKLFKFREDFDITFCYLSDLIENKINCRYSSHLRQNCHTSNMKSTKHWHNMHVYSSITPHMKLQNVGVRCCIYLNCCTHIPYLDETLTYMHVYSSITQLLKSWKKGVMCCIYLTSCIRIPYQG